MYGTVTRDEKLTEIVRFRVTPTVYKDVKKTADNLGLTTADLWRRFYAVSKVIFSSDMTIGELFSNLPITDMFSELMYEELEEDDLSSSEDSTAK